MRTFASILFSSSVGRWVDQSPDRLRTLLSTVSINRISVFCASILWFFIVQRDDAHGVGLLSTSGSLVTLWKGAIFALIIAMGILEGLSANGNMLSMERDWVVTAASPNGQPYDLTQLNSSMRRIDLICKLIAPITLSIVISTTSTQTGVLVVGSMSTISWAVEYWCARRVWLRNPRLKAPKATSDHSSPDTASSSVAASFISRAKHSVQRYTGDFRTYFSSPVWIPSLSLALLHISALAYNATFITYLLTIGFSLDLITIARAAGSVVEIGSTVVTPVGVRYLGSPKTHSRYNDPEDDREEATETLLEMPQVADEVKTEMGLERLGLWGISFQLINLVLSTLLAPTDILLTSLQLPVVFALWSLSPSTTPPSLLAVLPRFMGQLPSQTLVAFILFFFLSISRLGLWVYDLTTQQLTQTMTESSQRSSFAGVEYSFVSLFELAHHVLTIILHRPEQFKWIAGISLLAVTTSTVAYAGWVWKMRGHLVHWEKIRTTCKCVELRANRWRGEYR